MEEFLAMGGYAGFVWPAYALTTAVLVAVLVATWRGLRRRRRQLDALQAALGGRRARRARPAPPAEADASPASPPPRPLEHRRDA
jgi:heme exporter protein D